MLRFCLTRLLTGFLVIYAVATITFFLLRVLPGGPFDEDKVLPPEIKENIERKYGLSDPVILQYVRYLGDLARGDFGPSYKYTDRSVNDIVLETMPVSAKLGIASLGFALLLGVAMGVASSVRPGGAFDLFGLSISTALVSVPSFVIGALLVYLFAVRLGILPAALWGRVEHYVLPAVTLAAGPAAYIARIVRGSMLEVRHMPFVTAARAKGLSTARLVLKHMLRNALIPLVTVLGPIAAYLVTGSFVVEHIFEIPGMGKFFVTAVSNRDYPLVMGITVVYTAILVASNLAVDLCYALLDPRITFEKRG
jgi:oligopeptide transport system permease protein